WNYPVYRPIQRQDIELALRVLPKRAGIPRGLERRPGLLVCRSAAGELEALHEARAVVAVQILPHERRDLGTAIHVAAGDRAGTTGVRIFEHGQSLSTLIACRRVVAMRSLHHVPTEIQTSPKEVRRRGNVDLL